MCVHGFVNLHKNTVKEADKKSVIRALFRKIAKCGIAIDFLYHKMYDIENVHVHANFERENISFAIVKEDMKCCM